MKVINRNVFCSNCIFPEYMSVAHWRLYCKQPAMGSWWDSGTPMTPKTTDIKGLGSHGSPWTPRLPGLPRLPIPPVLRVLGVPESRTPETPNSLHVEGFGSLGSPGLRDSQYPQNWWYWESRESRESWESKYHELYKGLNSKVRFLIGLDSLDVNFSYCARGEEEEVGQSTFLLLF